MALLSERDESSCESVKEVFEDNNDEENNRERVEVDWGEHAVGDRFEVLEHDNNIMNILNDKWIDWTGRWIY